MTQQLYDSLSVPVYETSIQEWRDDPRYGLGKLL
jgi:hypothetical protein